MTIRIVTDSTCDLPQSIIDRYGITVLPLHINFGTQSVLDGVDITRAEFYDRLRRLASAPTADAPAPTTAAPGTERFLTAYAGLAAAGATQILSIHVAASLSATTDVARVAATQFAGSGMNRGATVTVIDSQQLSMGVGFIVEAAACAAAEGLALAAVQARIDDLIRRTHVFAALDTLEFLKRSGRMNGVLAGLGSLLQLKPILRMHRGKAGAERVRTSARAMARLVEISQEVGPIERAVLLHGDAPARAEQLRHQAQAWLPVGELPSYNITPVIGAHIGPGAVGLAVVTAAR